MKRRKFIGLSAGLATLSTERGLSQTPAAKPLVSFGLITDVQYADADAEGERHYRESPAKLGAAVELLAGKKLPFTLHLGDLIDRDFKSFDPVLEIFGKLGHPVYHLLGNHDFTVDDAVKSKVVAKLGMPHDYYSFTHSGVRFVMMDTNDRSVYKHPADSRQTRDSGSYMKRLSSERNTELKPWNGAVSAEQLAWIDRELTAADQAGEPVILCGHHPLLPADGHELWNNGEVIALIGRHPSVVAGFCGHHHAGAEVMRDGIPYITFKSILHEPGITAHAIVHLFKDKLEIEGFGREKSRVIPLKGIG
jgi:manganese-dependent ADP-ribose/CDP-alcohol diphosphatase